MEKLRCGTYKYILAIFKVDNPLTVISQTICGIRIPEYEISENDHSEDSDAENISLITLQGNIYTSCLALCTKTWILPSAVA